MKTSLGAVFLAGSRDRRAGEELSKVLLNEAKKEGKWEQITCMS